VVWSFACVPFGLLLLVPAIDTPDGEYNPDWAMVKHNDESLYLDRETKSTRDFRRLRTSEADKVRSGQKHFGRLAIPFSVVVGAEEV